MFGRSRWVWCVVLFVGTGHVWAAGWGRSETAGRPPAVGHAPSIIDNTGHMDVNALDMVVTNHGSFASDLNMGTAGLVYPRGTSKTAVFAAGLWVGAKVGGETRLAIGGYFQEYVPGPMVNGTFQPDDANFKNYRIDRGNTTSQDYMSWPAQDGAPVDAYGNPLFLGDATMWSVYNDANPSMHTALGGGTMPLGIETQQTTFAFSRAGSLGDVIFLKFKVLNKGGNQLDSTYFSAWFDPDLGGLTDDLVGCDTTESLGYCYNATNADLVYGASPPAVGCMLLQGPKVQVSPGVYDTLGVFAFTRFINGTDPSSPAETYNLMRGLHADGTPIHVYDVPGQPVTRFPFSGDPVTGTGWLDSNPADRRFMLTTGPFTMAPGDSQEIIAAILIGHGVDRLASVAGLRSTAAIVRVTYDFQIPTAISATLLEARAEPGRVRLTWTSPGSPGLASWVFRRDAESDWSRLGVATEDAAGHLTYEDESVIGGRSYAYRLVVRNEFEEYTTDEVWVDVPETAPRVLRFDAPRPNPVRASSFFAYALPLPGHVRLSLYDVRGRLVAVPINESRPAGLNLLNWDARGAGGQAVPSGVYLAVLEAGRERRLQKLIVAR